MQFFTIWIYSSTQSEKTSYISLVTKRLTFGHLQQSHLTLQLVQWVIKLQFLLHYFQLQHLHFFLGSISRYICSFGVLCVHTTTSPSYEKWLSTFFFNSITSKLSIPSFVSKDYPNDSFWSTTCSSSNDDDDSSIFFTCLVIVIGCKNSYFETTFISKDGDVNISTTTRRLWGELASSYKYQGMNSFALGLIYTLSFGGGGGDWYMLGYPPYWQGP